MYWSVALISAGGAYGFWSLRLGSHHGRNGDENME